MAPFPGTTGGVPLGASSGFRAFLSQALSTNAMPTVAAARIVRLRVLLMAALSGSPGTPGSYRTSITELCPP